MKKQRKEDPFKKDLFSWINLAGARFRLFENAAHFGSKTHTCAKCRLNSASVCLEEPKNQI